MKLIKNNDLNELIKNGYWYCSACQRITDPIEHDNGQPTGCELCGSWKIAWHPPITELATAPATHTKKILVRLEYHDQTRWIFDDKALADLIAHLASVAAAAYTAGPKPTATATPEN